MSTGIPQGCSDVSTDIELNKVFALWEELDDIIGIQAEPPLCDVFTGCTFEGVGKIKNLLAVKEHGQAFNSLVVWLNLTNHDTISSQPGTDVFCNFPERIEPG